ncbi:MAG: VWA domain-containing protein [Myxococcales bacterium]|nr:VWA domain-containing protein [Myxococcales bacterium]
MGTSLELLSAKGLWLLGLVAPLVVLYILRVRRPRLRVASVWLWAESRRDLLARAPWRRLIPLFPLLIQALVLIGLALAASRPASRGHTIVGEHVAIVIDTSASMAATEPDGVTRIEHAKNAARALVASLAPGATVLVLDAGRDAVIALPPERDTRLMLQAIDRMGVREAEGDIGAAVDLAASRLAQAGGSRRIFVITDGNVAKDTALAAAVPIEIVTVGKPIENAGIVRIDVRAGDDAATGREEVQTFLLLGNFGTRARELYVTLRQAGASDTLASRKLTVNPGEKLPVVLTFRPTPGDRGMPLVVELSPPDALAVDDVAYGRVPLGRSLPVVLASAGEPSSWLERALRADPDVKFSRLSLNEVVGSGVPDDALVVIEGACPAAPAGGDLVIANPPEGTCFGAGIGKTLSEPELSSWEHGDARLRFLSLDGVFIKEARALEPESRRQELLRTEQGTIAVDASTAARFVTILGFDVAETDWPFKASFVVFARNLLELARQHRGGAAASARAGEPLRVTVPAGVTKLELLGPDGVVSELSVRAGVAIVPEVRKVGHYRLRWSEPKAGSVLVPVNLTSAAESDLRRTLSVVATAGAEVLDTPAAALGLEEHAPYLALVVLAFIVVDIWYFTRRRRSSATKLTPETAATRDAHAR